MIICSVVVLLIGCVVGEYEPEWGSWNRYGERSATSGYDSPGTPDFNYVPSTKWLVLKHESEEVWLWFNDDGAVVSYWPPGEGQYGLPLFTGRINTVTIMGVEYSYRDYSNRYTITMDGNEATIDVISSSSSYGALRTPGKWTTVPRHTLRDRVPEYCFAGEVVCG